MNLLTINRYSFAFIGFITGLVIPSLMNSYLNNFYTGVDSILNNYGFWGAEVLIIPGLMFGGVIISFISYFTPQKIYRRFIIGLLIFILAFIVSYFIARFFLFIGWFFSGIAGVVIICGALYKISGFSIKKYILPSIVAGVTGFLFIRFEPRPHEFFSYFWLFPVWQMIVGFFIGLIHEKKYYLDIKNTDILISGKRKALFTYIILFILIFVHVINLPKITPETTFRIDYYTKKRFFSPFPKVYHTSFENFLSEKGKNYNDEPQNKVYEKNIIDNVINKYNEVKIFSPAPGNKFQSPIEIKGVTLNNLFKEDAIYFQFTIDGKIISDGYLKVDGNGFTGDHGGYYLPFKGSAEFIESEDYSDRVLDILPSNGQRFSFLISLGPQF